MNWIVLICVVLGAVASILLCVKGAKTPLTIKFSYMPIDWFIPIFSSVPWVMFAFAVEYFISGVIAPVNVDKTTLVYFLIRAYENGLFIPLLSVGVSWLFYNSVKSLHLQYLPYYSDTVPKVCFSVIVLAFCVVLKIGVLDKFKPSDGEYDLMLNRILMWALTILGTWIGFGFGCKSDVERDNAIIRESNEGAAFKDKLKFWAPIICALIVCVIVMFVSISSMFDKVFICFFSFALAFLLFGGITLTIIIRKRNLSRRRSLKLFIQVQNSHKKTGFGEGQFGELFYSLDKDKLIIKPRTVVYEGHQEDKDFKELFAPKPILLGKSGDKYDKAWKKLEETLDEQDNYIKKELKACIKAEREKKRAKLK